MPPDSFAFITGALGQTPANQSERPGRRNTIRFSLSYDPLILSNRVPIEINPQGDEGEIGFSLSFDSKLLRDPWVSLGMSLASGSITLFTDQLGGGRIGITLSFPPGEPLPAGNKQILLVQFAIAADAPAGETAIGFIDQPTMRKVLSGGGTILPASFLSGPVKIER